MKKIFFRITLLPVLILFAAASVSSAGILFYDDFNDTVYTDKWEVLHQSSLTTITEFGANLHLYSQKPSGADPESAVLMTKTFFSSQNLTVEARIKPLGRGGMWVMLFKDWNNYFRFGFSTDDTNYIEADIKYGGTYEESKTCCSDILLDSNYHTFLIKKSGSQYQVSIDGIPYLAIPPGFIGDSNLQVGLWSETFSWKSGDADNYIDYVKVDDQQQPQCPSWPTSGCPECTCAPVTLDEMGWFDSNGKWTYNDTYLEDMSIWGTCNASTQTTMWEPKEALIWNASPFGPPNLQVQHKPSGFATRAYLQLPQIGISYPEVYRWIYPNGRTHAFSAQFQCPANTPPGTCCPPNFINTSEPIPFESIESICWLQNEAIKGCVTQADHPTLFDLVNENLLSLSYEFQNPPNAPNYSPTRGKYSFWAPLPAPPNGPWRYQDFPVIYALVGIGQAPALNVPSTLRVRFNGTDHDLQFIGGDTSSPPLVQTYTTKTVGSTKHPQTVTEKHVWAYENGGNLVIKWDEPADLLEPYWQIRVVIGNSNAVGNEIATIPVSPVTYAILEVPPPSTTAVLPAAAWTALKNAIGADSIRISIWYRRFYQNAPPTGGGEVMQVRSQSDYLEY